MSNLTPVEFKFRVYYRSPRKQITLWAANRIIAK